MSYYKNYWIFMNNPLAGAYLKWAYKKGIKDLEKLNFYPDFNKDNFSCLLCGVGNERTAEEFIEFVIKKNKKSKIYIIDINEEHLSSVRDLVFKKYSDLNIHIEKVNAFNLLDTMKPETIDWIETDCFIEFFDNSSLKKLFDIWHKILKSDGFITTRDYMSDDRGNIFINPLRNFIMKVWLGVKIYEHKKEDFDNLFKDSEFKVFIGSTFVPTYKRFSLIKNNF